MAENPKRSEVIALAGVIGLGGIGLIIYALTRPAPGAPSAGTLKPGESMTNLHAANLDTNFVIPVQLPFTMDTWAGIFSIQAIRPQVTYVGPGRNTYTYAAVRQLQNGQLVTVAASGLAPVHIGPASTPTVFDLVSPTQQQPSGCQAQALCVYPWPGTNVNPICGAPAQAGPADLYLEIYQEQADSGDSRDATGVGSPSCLNRRFVIQKRYPGKVTFTR
jgi:hypothetical protein